MFVLTLNLQIQSTTNQKVFLIVSALNILKLKNIFFVVLSSMIEGQLSP